MSGAEAVGGERPDCERPQSMVGVNVRLEGGERDGLLGAIMTGSPGKWVVLAASEDELGRGFPLAWFRVPSEHVELVFYSWDSYVEWHTSSNGAALSETTLPP